MCGTERQQNTLMVQQDACGTERNETERKKVKAEGREIQKERI